MNSDFSIQDKVEYIIILISEFAKSHSYDKHILNCRIKRLVFIFRSSRYVYDFLKTEIKTGKLS
jgi:hypothetical protein